MPCWAGDIQKRRSSRSPSGETDLDNIIYQSFVGISWFASRQSIRPLPFSAFRVMRLHGSARLLQPSPTDPPFNYAPN